MSLPIAFLIMIIAGVLGGSVNYLLPANENSETLKKVRGWFQCVVLGFGATFLIPLFLELAQSKLLDNMHMGWNWLPEEKVGDTKKVTVSSKRDTVVLHIVPADTQKKKQAETTYLPLRTPPKANSINNGGTPPDGEGNKGESDPLKAYLLFGAYCLLAAAAGFKFINMLINNVVKEQELTAKTNKIEDLKKEKEKREKNSQISQQQEETKVRQEVFHGPVNFDAANYQNISVPFFPVLPPITHPEDPQKGRFGGKSKNNFRELKAGVSESRVPNFYNVTIWVESTDPINHPLNSNVIFYIHDSFSPSVYAIKPNEFREGKALDDEILSYGAFTVGAITDDGQTMLELDLAEDATFPKQFRER